MSYTANTKGAATQTTCRIMTHRNTKGGIFDFLRPEPVSMDIVLKPSLCSSRYSNPDAGTELPCPCCRVGWSKWGGDRGYCGSLLAWTKRVVLSMDLSCPWRSPLHTADLPRLLLLRCYAQQLLAHARKALERERESDMVTT
jgi:hypothetical protein